MDNTKDIGDVLQGLSLVAHLMRILYRKHGTAFIPSELYDDVMATLRGFFVVKKAQTPGLRGGKMCLVESSI